MTGEPEKTIFSSKLTDRECRLREAIMKDFSFSSIFSSGSEVVKGSASNKSCFWKSLKKTPRQMSLEEKMVLSCSNIEDIEVLSNLVLQKVKRLKTVENIYVNKSANY